MYLSINILFFLAQTLLCKEAMRGGNVLRILLLCGVLATTGVNCNETDPSLMQNFGSCSPNNLGGNFDSSESSGALEAGYPVDIPAPLAKSIDGIDGSSVTFHEGVSSNISTEFLISTEYVETSYVGKVTFKKKNGDNGDVFVVKDGVIVQTLTPDFDGDAYIYTLWIATSDLDNDIFLVVPGSGSKVVSGASTGDVSFPVTIRVTQSLDTYVLTVLITATAITVQDTDVQAEIKETFPTSIDTGDIIATATNDSGILLTQINYKENVNSVYTQVDNEPHALKSPDSETVYFLDEESDIFKIDPDSLDEITLVDFSGNIPGRDFDIRGNFMTFIIRVSHNSGPTTSSMAFKDIDTGVDFIPPLDPAEQVVTKMHVTWFDESKIIVGKKFADGTTALQIWNVGPYLIGAATSPNIEFNYTGVLTNIGHITTDDGALGNAFFECNDGEICKINQDTKEVEVIVSSNLYKADNPVLASPYSYLMFEAIRDENPAPVLGVYSLETETVTPVAMGQFATRVAGKPNLIAYIGKLKTEEIQVALTNLGNIPKLTQTDLSITPTSIYKGLDYITSLSGVGGIPPYTFNLVSGTGILDTSLGLFKGTGVGAATIKVKDDAGSQAAATVTTIAHGGLDPSFAENGIATNDLGTNDGLRTVTINSNGKIIAAGVVTQSGQQNTLVVRYKADGSLDTTFDTDGVATFNVADGADRAQAIIIDLQGRILICGLLTNATPNKDAYVMRLTAAGALDSTFATGGLNKLAYSASVDDACHGMNIGTDGSIYVGGDISESSSVFVVSKLDTSGNLDSSYGTSGSTKISFGTGDAILSDIVISNTNQIYAGGSYTPDGSSNSDFAMAKLNASGVLDTSFSTDGITTTDFGGDDVGGKMFFRAAAPKDKIFMAGTTTAYGTTDIAVLAGFSDGNLDTSFDSDGLVTLIDADGTDGDGDILYTDNGLFITGAMSSGSELDWAVIRLKADGTRDTDFGVDGIANIDINADDKPRGIMLDSDKRIITVGGTDTGSDVHSVAIRMWP